MKINTDSIRYFPSTTRGGHVRVLLGMKHVGTIKPDVSPDRGNGFRYWPKGSYSSGAFFSTVEECKKSLEAE